MHKSKVYLETTILKTKTMVPAINQNEGYLPVIITQSKEVI
jgi:hypothetical protein